MTNDSAYLGRAVKTIRYAVYPGQLGNGRWGDGHNASSRYQNLMIQNIIPTVNLLPTTASFSNEINSMTHLSVKNLIDYTDNCGSATGFRWLTQAYQLPDYVITNNVKDFITNLIGQHINQASINGKYLDVPSMGAYLILLDVVSGVHDSWNVGLQEPIVFPNPFVSQLGVKVNLDQNSVLELTIYSLSGVVVRRETVMIN